MKVNINNRIEEFINQNNNNYDLREVAFLAIARRCDEHFEIFKIFKCYINSGERNSVKIPKIDQLHLIKYCINNNMIPVLIHTHIGNKYVLEFSYKDLEFEKAFIKACEILGYNDFILWVLYGKEGYIAKKYIDNKYTLFNINHNNLVKCVNKNIEII